MSLAILWKDCEGFYGVTKWTSTSQPPHYYMNSRNREEIMRVNTKYPDIVKSLFFEHFGKKKKKYNSTSKHYRSKCKDPIRAKRVFLEKIEYVKMPWFNTNDYENKQTDADDDYLTEDELDDNGSTCKKDSAPEDNSINEKRIYNNMLQRKRKFRVLNEDDEEDESITQPNKKVKVNEDSSTDNSSHCVLSKDKDSKPVDVETCIQEVWNECGLDRKIPAYRIKEIIHYLVKYTKGKLKPDIKRDLEFLKDDNLLLYRRIYAEANAIKERFKKNNIYVTQ